MECQFQPVPMSHAVSVLPPRGLSGRADDTALQVSLISSHVSFVPIWFVRFVQLDSDPARYERIFEGKTFSGRATT